MFLIIGTSRIGSETCESCFSQGSDVSREAYKDGVLDMQDEDVFV